MSIIIAGSLSERSEVRTVAVIAVAVIVALIRVAIIPIARLAAPVIILVIGARFRSVLLLSSIELSIIAGIILVLAIVS